VRLRVEEKLAQHAATGGGDVAALAGRAGARLRVGDYRVIFIETETVVEVVAVGHRRDIYR
jgi:mRNA interferase RelE/StbE